MREAFRDDISWSQHFWFDKAIVRSGAWARLPRAAQAAFPVIAAHCDKHGKAFPSQWRIGAQCGRTERALCAPLRKLVQQLNCLTRELKPTSLGRQQHHYRITSAPRQKGRSFPFQSFFGTLHQRIGYLRVIGCINDQNMRHVSTQLKNEGHKTCPCCECKVKVQARAYGLGNSASRAA